MYDHSDEVAIEQRLADAVKEDAVQDRKLVDDAPELVPLQVLLRLAPAEGEDARLAERVAAAGGLEVQRARQRRLQRCHLRVLRPTRWSPRGDDRGARTAHLRKVFRRGRLPVENDPIPTGEGTVRIGCGEVPQQRASPRAPTEARTSVAGRRDRSRVAELGGLDDGLPLRAEIGD